MLIKLDVHDDRPLYRQIVSAIKRAVRDEALTQGDRLPATRDLAGSLGVNMHTVLRAYGLLRDEGVIELRRGRGAVVVGQPDDEVEQLTTAVIEAARRQGVGKADLIALIDKEFS